MLSVVDDTEKYKLLEVCSVEVDSLARKVDEDSKEVDVEWFDLENSSLL